MSPEVPQMSPTPAVPQPASQPATLYFAPPTGNVMVEIGAVTSLVTVGPSVRTFKLPAVQEWMVGPSENPNKILRCQGILVEAAIQGGGGSIRVSNTESLKSADARKEAAEEKRRRSFKP